MGETSLSETCVCVVSVLLSFDMHLSLTKEGRTRDMEGVKIGLMWAEVELSVLPVSCSLSLICSEFSEEIQLLKQKFSKMMILLMIVKLSSSPVFSDFFFNHSRFATFRLELCTVFSAPACDYVSDTLINLIPVLKDTRWWNNSRLSMDLIGKGSMRDGFQSREGTRGGNVRSPHLVCTRRLTVRIGNTTRLLQLLGLFKLCCFET